MKLRCTVLDDIYTGREYEREAKKLRTFSIYSWFVPKRWIEKDKSRDHWKRKMTERVGAVILLREDGAALLQLRDVKEGLRNAGMWVPPGGHAEPGETIETCARREFFEETNYNCSSLQWLTDLEDSVEGWPPYQLTVFWTSYDSLQKIHCNEGQALEFICREDANLYDIPFYLMNIWDMALHAAKRKGVIP